MSLIIFLIVLSVLIFIHESGHFLMARRLGIKVEKFSLGFGPRLFGFMFKGVNFKVCIIPFGGYVKLAGDTRREHHGNSWEYLSRPPGQRAQVVFCGPLSNYIFAILFLWVVYCIGYPQLSTTVGKVLDDMPAKQVGIQEGDSIVEINGIKTPYWEDVMKHIKGKVDDVIRIKVLRDGEPIEFTIVPITRQGADMLGRKKKIALVGIVSSQEFVKERYPLFVAFYKSLLKIGELTWLTLQAIFSLITGRIALKDAVTGPIGIFTLTSEAAKYGFDALVHVTSVISLALAIFNVLPIPVLDGGHILFLGIEKLRGKPLSEKVEDRITNIGFSFILLLAVVIVYNDLVRFGYLDKLKGLIE